MGVDRAAEAVEYGLAVALLGHAQLDAVRGQLGQHLPDLLDVGVACAARHRREKVLAVRLARDVVGLVRDFERDEALSARYVRR
ncbi:hypothetical protein ACWDA3_26195 [Nonomuraea rubra]